MAKIITTIYFNDSSIDLLVLKEHSVDRWASMPLEPGLISQGQIVDEEQVINKIRELLKLEGISAKRVVFGLSGLNSVFRIATLPELPDTILTEAVRHEASRMLPVSIDEVYLTFQRIPSLEGETRVFLAATPRSMVDSLLKVAGDAGLDPYLIGLAPLALSRTVDEPRSVILNATNDQLSIIVLAERLPQVIRSLPLAGDTEEFSDNITAISEELGRTVTFYNSMHMESPLDDTVPIYVGGRLAEIEDRWSELIGHLENPVSLFPLPIEVPEGFNSNDYLVSIGLALKELSVEKEDNNVSLINMNILPTSLQPTPVPWAKILIPVGAVVAVGALAYLGLVLLQNATARTSELENELASTNRDITQVNTEIATLSDQVTQAEATILPLEGIATIYESVYLVTNEERLDLNGDMSPTVSLAQGEVYITSISHQGTNATVAGVAPSEDNVFTYARNLRGSGRYQGVAIEYINQDPDEENEDKRFGFELRLID